FANPGIHVETNNPAVRIVLVDAFRRYASSIPEMPPVLPPSAVKTIVTLLGEANSKARTPVKEEVSQQRANPLLAMIDQLKFSRKQWIVLIALFAFLVLLLMGFVLYVLLF
ncbi:MAG: hypothetical protein GY805_09455, partial [Chloroflexi bacterium]|nr:hypothetical protein [Chloroflexota bacterium]